MQKTSLARERWTRLLHSVFVEKAVVAEGASEVVSDKQIAAIDSSALVTVEVDGIVYVPVFGGMGSSSQSLRDMRWNAASRHLSTALINAWCSPWFSQDGSAGPSNVSDCAAGVILTKHDQLGKSRPKLLLDFGNLQACTDLKLHFVGDVILTGSNGQQFKGSKYLAGSIEIGGADVNVFVTPDQNMNDARGAVCVPAWQVKVLKPEAPPKVSKAKAKAKAKATGPTMALKTAVFETNLPGSLIFSKEDVKVNLNIRYLVPVPQDNLAQTVGTHGDVQDHHQLLELSRATQDSDEKPEKLGAGGTAAQWKLNNSQSLL